MRGFLAQRINLAIVLVLLVFGVMAVTFLLVGGSALLLQYKGIIALPKGHKDPPYLLITMLFGLCIIIGTLITAFFSRKALDPIRKVIDATHRVAGGDFHVKIELKGIGELEELSHSFNRMTQELATIETLRSDFINNFSHEFKTPIVSIRGFAKLLKENQLTEEERREYLDIIISESERLTALSTNVLLLSKYENLEIIADQAPFRLDEQLRRTIVLLEPKWSAKAITVDVALDEVWYTGNEDITQQIWLNLLDNAIKFSDHGGLVHIALSREENLIRFVIQDDGPGMDEPLIARIFDKFYQGDPSRASSGCGLGLPLVRRIVSLCGGEISVLSEPGKGSTFTVVLPSGS